MGGGGLWCASPDFSSIDLCDTRFFFERFSLTDAISSTIDKIGSARGGGLVGGTACGCGLVDFGPLGGDDLVDSGPSGGGD